MFPEEVEEVLKLHPEGADAMAVGIPDDRFGQAVTAVVELRAGGTVDETELIAHTKTKLAGYKAPRRVRFVESMRTGAYRKGRLREALGRDSRDRQRTVAAG